MTFEIILGIVLTSILSGNYALVHFLGTGAVIENHRTRNRSLALGLGTTLVMVLTTLITWPINHFLLEKVSYLQTFVFVLVVLGVVELLHVIAKNILDNYSRSDFVKFAINGAVLGICIHNTEHIETLGSALITSLAVGVGFMLTMTVYAKLKDVPVDEEAIPASFRGLPIALLTAGMMVLALLALTFNV